MNLTAENFKTEGLSMEQKAALVDAIYAVLNGLPVTREPEVFNVLKRINGKDAEQSRIHKLVIQQWSEWREQETGLKPHVMGKHAAAAKQIASYLLRLQRDTGKPADNMLPFIFANWSKIDTFLQSQTDLNQILSNLNNIIPQVKNGKPTRNKQQPKDSDLETAAQQRFGNGKSANANH